uniref:Uncharacterized protein n=1 Tax=Curvibacter symbiont subsp. Hydra magnipapillata TaxID=667019 RepID=C9YA92_CURXX|nr:hypothetical protein Csp_A10430 [Curvibacter putative symbiont of Hydra magnipapillata]
MKTAERKYLLRQFCDKSLKIGLGEAPLFAPLHWMRFVTYLS